jgi:hypothetical protein
MTGFQPSDHFVAKVMAAIESYDAASTPANDCIDRLLQSKFALSALSIAGVIFGIINLMRFALMFISPALCQ